MWSPLNNFNSPYFDPFPAIGKYRLRYSATPVVTFDAPVGYGLQTYRANSIYDPDYTGVGHQPYGHDTLQSLYNHYVVDACRIYVTPVTGNTDCITGIAVTDDPVSIVSVSGVREQKGTTVMVNGADGAPKQRLMATYNRFKQWPMPVDTSAAFGTNPDEQIYFKIFLQSFGSEPTARFLVNIEYDVTCYELKDLTES